MQCEKDIMLTWRSVRTGLYPTLLSRTRAAGRWRRGQSLPELVWGRDLGVKSRRELSLAHSLLGAHRTLSIPIQNEVALLENVRHLESPVWLIDARAGGCLDDRTEERSTREVREDARRGAAEWHGRWALLL